MGCLLSSVSLLASRTGKGVVIGFLKVGYKKLFVLVSYAGQLPLLGELLPLCLAAESKVEDVIHLELRPFVQPDVSASIQGTKLNKRHIDLGHKQYPWNQYSSLDSCFLEWSA